MIYCLPFNFIEKPMAQYLDFEKPIAELEGKISELKLIAHAGELNIAEEIIKLQSKVSRLLSDIYSTLTPWQKVQVARHPERPQFLDYLTYLFTDFIELSGDRLFAEDAAIIAGFATFQGQKVMVIGQQKGHETDERIKHNFGMAKPEGYRKAQRLMKLADTCNLPIITFIDTAGAYPGIEAEERGQAEAIASCMDVSAQVSVPIISVIIGEGGSGGAIALGVANEVLMLEHAIYSVISPEGCASILWHSSEKASTAAVAQKLTAQDLKALNIIDHIIPEPLGGAHRASQEMYQNFSSALKSILEKITKEARDSDMKAKRREKFMAMTRMSA
jgi:acetyl-CoA carboxylase carboxyl transferase subunit alpha